MPLEALRDPQLTPSEFKVLVTLYSFRDKNADTSFPKLTALAARAGLKDSTQVSKITTRLESKGWLTKRQKMGFHGPKKYVLNIPDRLLLPPETAQDGKNTQNGNFSQLGKNAQLGKTDPERGPQRGVDLSNLEDSPNMGKSPNLGKSTKLGKATITNLDKTTNSQLGKNYQGYKEHTSKNIPIDHSSEPIGSAASAGQPVDKSILTAYEKFYDQPDQDDPKKPNLFNVGIRVMIRAGIPEDRARKTLAKLQREFGKGAVIDALLECVIYRPEEPIGYLYSVLQVPRSQLPKDWIPGDDVVEELHSLGMPTGAIRKACDFFRFWISEREVTSANWSEYFKRWCIQDLERADFDAHRHQAWIALDTEAFREPA